MCDINMCIYIYMHNYILIYTVNRRLSPRLCAVAWFWSGYSQRRQRRSCGFSMAILSSGSCSGLEPKGQVDAPLGGGSLRAELCGSVQCSVAYTLFAYTIILYCIIYKIILYYIIWCYIILHYIILCYIILYYIIVFYFIILYYYILSYYIILYYYIIPYCITLDYILLYYIIM